MYNARTMSYFRANRELGRCRRDSKVGDIWIEHEDEANVPQRGIFEIFIPRRFRTGISYREEINIIGD